MLTYCITVTQCAGQKPCVVEMDFHDITDATKYAFGKWPRAAKIEITPLKAVAQKEAA